ncbi:MAG: hypothetical protein FWG05_02395 [Kiritimatiellaeota bacterium]|nr:hypothetical protein [Kiritimatiellota bacterium]
MQRSLLIGIDQGGTKSQVAICDADGNIVGAATGAGAIFYQRDPDNKSIQTARALADEILSGTGLPWDCVAAACGGLSGVDWPHEIPIHEARLRSGLGLKNVIAVNDSVIALRAGSAAPNRCVVVAGTGLNIATHAEDGAEYTYGYYIPYRLNGGGSMGWSVIDTIIEAAAGVRPPTLLTDVALKLSGCATAEQFLIDFTGERLPDFKPQLLYPGLVESARADDAAANEIIGAFTEKLALFLENALTRHLPPGRPAELVYSGGVFKGVGRFVSDALTRILAPKFPFLRFVNARLEPVCGALLMLLDKHHNNDIPAHVQANFEAGCVKHGLLRQ